MADWKYIAYRVGDQTVPFIFPGFLVHQQVAVSLNPLMSDFGKRSAPIDSAGFVNGLACVAVSGKSESLADLRCNESVASIINLMPYDNGREPIITGYERLLLMKTAEMLMQRALSPLGETP